MPISDQGSLGIRTTDDTFVASVIWQANGHSSGPHPEETVVGRAPTLVAAFQGADSVLEEVLPRSEPVKWVPSGLTAAATESCVVKTSTFCPVAK